MADIAQVKVYFLEPFNGAGYGTYTDAILGFTSPAITVSAVNGNIITFSTAHGLDGIGTDAQAILSNAATPANMILDVDANNPGSPGSCGVTVVDSMQLRLGGTINGIAAGHRVIIYAWVDRSGYILSETLSVPVSYDRQDSASFTVKTTAAQFIPYAGMHVLIKYGSGATLFGGVIKSAPVTLPGAYEDTDTLLFIQVSCATYQALARKRHILQTSAWANTFAGKTIQNGQMVGVVWNLMQYLLQEGVTEGQIDAGAVIQKFPQSKKYIYPLNTLLDSMAKLSGYQWYINPDKGFYFIPLILPFIPDAQIWEPAISWAPFSLNVGDSALPDGAPASMTDFRDMTIETAIDNYDNSISVEGGEDSTKARVYSVGRFDSQIKINQYRSGGSGVWGVKINNRNINLLKTMAATGVSGKVITFGAAHGLLAGDFVFNATKGPNYKGTRISATTTYTITLDNVFSVGLAVGDKIGWYPQALQITQNTLKEAGTALPKRIHFSTFTIGNGTRIWAPNQRLYTNIAAFGPSGTGHWLIETVEYKDIGGVLQIDVSGSLKDEGYFTANPQAAPPDPEGAEED